MRRSEALSVEELMKVQSEELAAMTRAHSEDVLKLQRCRCRPCRRTLLP